MKERDALHPEALAMRGKPQAPPGSGAEGVSSRTSEIPVRFPVAAWRLPRWWLTAVNLVLGSLVGAELIALLLVATRLFMPTAPREMTPPPSPFPASTSMSASPGESAPFPSPGPSLASAASRPLFRAAETAEGPLQQASPANDQAKALAARFNVVGIVTGTPMQAILEDAQTKKTYFVSAGQGLTNGLLVQEVRPGCVVLSFEGERVELSL